MKCRFKTNMSSGGKAGFTLIEVAASVVILGIIVSSLLVVFNRYIDMATNQDLKMQAFELARENMERLLSLDQVTELTDYGVSEKNPEIQWETTIETFYEPLTSRMWVRAICSADYLDNEGEEHKIELYDWLTDVSKKQLIQIMEQKQRQMEYEKQLAAEEGREYNPEGADSTNPDETKNPDAPKNPDEPAADSGDKPTPPAQDGFGGYTWEQLDAMTFDQIWKILWESDGSK